MRSPLQVQVTPHITTSAENLTEMILARASLGPMQAAMTEPQAGAQPAAMSSPGRLQPLFVEQNIEDEGYRLGLYDYGREQAVIVSGASLTSIESIVETDARLLPSIDEFEAAVTLVRADKKLGPAIAAGQLTPYRPMPPMRTARLRSGQKQRRINVGLMPAAGSAGNHEIVSVSLGTGKLTRSPKASFRAQLAAARVCGTPNAQQATSRRGDQGAFGIVVSDASGEIWRFTAIRPAASSGTNGSGIELREVYYRGKKVLARAHAPILNVRYLESRCGPAYRDWAWEEGMFQADGNDIAPGFRECTSPPQTIFELDADEGNFKGLALYRTDDAVMLVSELEAGWYRYVSKWTLFKNGVIQPRFGFAGVANSCVCNRHHHHVYWRFDFDIVTGDHNQVQEFNDPPVNPPDNYSVLSKETRRLKNAATGRHWRVVNTQTHEGFLLIPGAEDGQSDNDFGVGDFWALRHHKRLQFDDGQTFTTNPRFAKAQIGRFVNGERIDNHNVVVWYAAHFVHDIGDPHDTPHIVGPELKPVNW